MSALAVFLVSVLLSIVWIPFIVSTLRSWLDARRSRGETHPGEADHSGVPLYKRWHWEWTSGEALEKVEDK